MYIPKHFEVDEQDAAIAVMREHNFATLVSQRGDEPFVTHCPLLVGEPGPPLVLRGHLAKANPHWKQWEAQPNVLAIFHGPHGYISPSLYGSRESVPTWNYVAVHAYGTIAAIHDTDAKHGLLKDLIAVQEPAYKAQWDALDAGFQERMLGAIVGFRIEVTRLEAKFKLGQNRPKADRENMMRAFANGGEDERAMAQWMQRLEPKP